MTHLVTALVNLVRREPAVLTTVVTAGLAAGATFGLHLSPSVTREVYGAASAVAALLIRHSVTPTGKPTRAPLNVEQRVAALEAALTEHVSA